MAQGWGAGATGGEGFGTFTVENLNPDGSKSFRAALGEAAANGGGLIKFEVGGVIDISDPLIPRLEIGDNITILGETAPDVPGKPPGITIYGRTWVTGDNVIVRNVRVRGSDKSKEHALVISGANEVLVERCSMAWGADETLDIANSNFVTIEYCIIAEGLKGPPGSPFDRSFGSIAYGNNITIHHNLFASSIARNGLFSGTGPTVTRGEFYNNVVYNWGTHGTQCDSGGGEVFVNIERNTFMPGQSIGPPPPTPNALMQAVHVKAGCHAFESSNDFRGGSGRSGGGVYRSSPFTRSMIPESAASAFANVMDDAGPEGAKDLTDARLIREVESGQGRVKSRPPQNEKDALTAP